MTRIDPPLVGTWFDGTYDRGTIAAPRFPSVVFLGDRTFRRSKMSERRPGVVAQYREHRSRDSMHLHVRGDGTWVIDHADDFNPDVGPYFALRHFFADHPIGRTVAGDD